MNDDSVFREHVSQEDAAEDMVRTHTEQNATRTSPTPLTLPEKPTTLPLEDDLPNQPGNAVGGATSASESAARDASNRMKPNSFRVRADLIALICVLAAVCGLAGGLAGGAIMSAITSSPKSSENISQPGGAPSIRKDAANEQDGSKWSGGRQGDDRDSDVGSSDSEGANGSGATESKDEKSTESDDGAVIDTSNISSSSDNVTVSVGSITADISAGAPCAFQEV